MFVIFFGFRSFSKHKVQRLTQIDIIDASHLYCYNIVQLLVYIFLILKNSND